MIQLTNFYGGSSIYINPSAISSLVPLIGEIGTLINTQGHNTYTVKEDAPTINSMIISYNRG